MQNYDYVSRMLDALSGDKSMQEAEGALENAIATNPGNVEAMLALAELYSYQVEPHFLNADVENDEKYNRAIGLVSKAIEINPSDSKIYYQLGILYLQAIHPEHIKGTVYLEKAKLAFEEGSAIAPTDTKFLERLGRIYAIETDYPKAEETLTTALEILSGRKNIFRYETGGKSMSIDLYRFARKDILITQALVYCQQEKYMQAEEALQSAREVLPGAMGPICMLAALYHDMGDWVKFNHLVSSPVSDPDDTTFVYMRAIGAYRQNDTSAAQKICIQSLQSGFDKNIAILYAATVPDRNNDPILAVIRSENPDEYRAITISATLMQAARVHSMSQLTTRYMPHISRVMEGTHYLQPVNAAALRDVVPYARRPNKGPSFDEPL